MIERLRFLLDRPLDPLAARAMVAFATAVLLGFAALYLLGSQESGRSAGPGRQLVSPPPSISPGAARAQEALPSPRTPRRRQDPQDRAGGPAARRAAEAMRSHRALQHVPYSHARLRIRLVGARGGKAEFAVSAPTIAAARRGWRRFLRRYRDDGRAYLPRFRATGAGHG